MRIAQIVTYISKDGSFGGPVAVAIAQCTQLAQMGHEVHLFAAWDGQATIDAPGVQLHLFKARRTTLGLTGILPIRLLIALRRRSRAFDAVHIHFGRDLVSLGSWLSSRGGGATTILQPHGMVMPDARIRARLIDLIVTRRALKHANTVLTLTQDEQHGLREVVGDDLATRHIDNGVQVPSSATFTRATSNVVFLARLHPRKQVMVFAQAAYTLLGVFPSATFTIIGPDEGDLPRLQSFITDHAAADRIFYKGTVGPGGALSVLSSAAALVLPSKGEVYPMTVLESLSVGTPVVLSADCGLSPSLRLANAAAIVDPTPEGVAHALHVLLHDEKARISLGQAGHQYALNNLSIAAVGERLELAYREEL